MRQTSLKNAPPKVMCETKRHRFRIQCKALRLHTHHDFLISPPFSLPQPTTQRRGFNKNQ
jgi:hypothetical protein